MGISVAIIFSWAVFNTYARCTLRYLLHTAILFNSVGIVALSIALLSKATPRLQTADFIFRKFIDYTGFDGAAGWSIRVSPAFVACLGCAPTQYTILGYDSAAHLAEETRKASKSVPVAMVIATVCSILTGFLFLSALLFSMDSVDDTLQSPIGQPIFQIIINVFGIDAGIVLICGIMFLIWLCGTFAVTASSRLVFAFSRDYGLVSFWLAQLRK
jgi:amino acid transporter